MTLQMQWAVPRMNTEWRRHKGFLILIGDVPQMSPIISSSFAKNDLQLKASYGSNVTDWRNDSPHVIGCSWHYDQWCDRFECVTSRT